MPAPDQQFLSRPQTTKLHVALEPAINGFNSLILLNWVDHMSGLDAWVEDTARKLSDEQRRRNRVVLEGLYFAVKPQRRWSSFPAYVDALAAEDPYDWRARLLDAYATMPCLEEDGTDDPDRAELLADVDIFLDYLRRRFSDEHVDEATERRAHALLNDPEAMQDVVISHFRLMWREVLKDEWERVLPRLQASADAFQQLDFTEQPAIDVARTITGQELEGWEEKLEIADEIIFVPSAHVGPYVSKCTYDDILCVIFGARLPEGSQVRAPELNRSELLVRLNALTDETRLHIIQMLTEQEEICAQDFIEELGRSQSTISRHLRQLSAAGYLNERRRDTAKCYSLNLERADDTVRALEAYFRPRR